MRNAISAKLHDAVATASFTIPASDVKDFDESTVYLDVTAASGTSPTMDITYQVSPDNGTNWYNHTALTQATGVTSERKVLTDPIGVLGRFNVTLGGTSPSFTFTLHQELKRT